MAKKIYKRRRSRFDPYRAEIEHLLAAGCTTSQITDAMQNHFERYITESSVYYYIRTNGLKTTVTKGAKDGRVYIPQCCECEKRCCVINTTGRRVWGCRVSDSEIRELPEKILDLEHGYENVEKSIIRIGWNACLDAIVNE